MGSETGAAVVGTIGAVLGGLYGGPPGAKTGFDVGAAIGGAAAGASIGSATIDQPKRQDEIAAFQKKEANQKKELQIRQAKRALELSESKAEREHRQQAREEILFRARALASGVARGQAAGGAGSTVPGQQGAISSTVAGNRGFLNQASDLNRVGTRDLISTGGEIFGAQERHASAQSDLAFAQGIGGAAGTIFGAFGGVNQFATKSGGSTTATGFAGGRVGSGGYTPSLNIFEGQGRLTLEGGI